MSSWLYHFIQFTLKLAFIVGGRRFVVQDGFIQETKIFGDENDWMKQLTLDCQAKSSGDLSAEKLLIKEVFQRSSVQSFTTLGSGSGPGIDTGSYSIRELTKSSFFCISKEGKVYERFFNGIQWVYMPHLSKPQRYWIKQNSNHGEYHVSSYEISNQPGILGDSLAHREHYVKSAVQLTAVIAGTKQSKEFHGYRGIVISDENGRLFQREPSETGSLRWVDISMENVKVFSGGVCGGGHTLFVSSTGNLYERNFRENIWIQYETHGIPVATILDVFTLIPDSIFVLTISGRLFELTNGKWINHEHPPEGILTLKPGVVLPDLNAVGSLFLLSSGMLVEYWWDKEENKWKWMSHGAPEGHKIVGAPGALKESTSLFMVSSQRILLERHWNGNLWTWIQHGSPTANSQLAYARPVWVGYPSSQQHVIVPLENGLLAALVQQSHNPINWEWKIIDVPEDGYGRYCTSLPGTEDSCTKAVE